MRRGWILLAVLALACWLPAGAAADYVWEETDWSGGAYFSLEQIDPEIQPGLLVLENSLYDWRQLPSPTEFQGLYCMHVYHDTLFFAASDYPFEFDGAEVITFDYRTGEFAVDYEPYESGLHIIKQFGDTLYIPGPDAMDPWTDDGSIYLYDGHAWIEKETVPVAVHVCDVEQCNGRLYVSTGHFDNPYHGHGCVWVSDDHGDTWTQALDLLPTYQHAVRRFYGLGHFGNRIFAQPDGWEDTFERLYTSTDGVEWDTLRVPGLVADKHATFIEWNGQFLMLNENRMFIWNGASFTRYTLPFHMWRWCRGFHGYEGRLYGGGDSGILHRWISGSQWETIAPVVADPATEEIESIATYYGRMYIATSRVSELDQARLYVSACDPYGNLVSVVHDFGAQVQTVRLFWGDVRPGESLTRFQLRSGETAPELLGAPFLGPDGTQLSYYLTPDAVMPELHNGDRYFQYRVELLSPEGTEMPCLEWVRLEADSLNLQGVAEEMPAGKPQVRLSRLWPNPARDGVELRLELGSVATSAAQQPVRIWILDAQGRVLRSQPMLAAAGSPAVWSWDLRDARGHRVPAGVYQALGALARPGATAHARRLVVMP